MTSSIRPRDVTTDAPTAPAEAGRSSIGSVNEGEGAGPWVQKAATYAWAPPRRTRTLVLIGLLAALTAGAYLWRELPAASDWTIQLGRLDLLERSVDVISERDGAPPLLVDSPTSTPMEPKYDHALSNGDDPGLFVFLPPLAYVLGISVLSALKLLLFGLFLVPIAYYPLVFYRLTGSALAAIASPFLLAYAVISHGISADLYWILGWAVLALLPLVLVAWRVRGRAGLAILLPAMVAASFASSIRVGAGLGVAISAIGVVAFTFKEWSKPRRAGAIAALVAAYLVVSPGLMKLVDHSARSWAGDDLVTNAAAGSNWHIAYIGLGYQPNDYGIYWLDGIAYARAQQEDPNVTYLGPGYDEILRTEFFNLVEDHPAWYAGLIVKKADVALIEAGASTLLFVVLSGLALAVTGPDRRLLRAAWLVALVPLVGGLAPGLIGIPGPSYVLGSTGTFAFLEIVEWGLLLTLLGRWAAPRLKAALAAPGLRSTGDGVLVLAGGVLPALVIAGPHVIRIGVIAAILVAAALLVLSAILSRMRRIQDRPGRTGPQLAALAAIMAAVLIYAAKEVAPNFNERYALWQADVKGQERSLGEAKLLGEPSQTSPDNAREKGSPSRGSSAGADG